MMKQSKQDIEQLLPSRDSHVCHENYSSFWDTMKDRQDIFYNKVFLGNEKYKSSNEIFSHYKFTNVYREFDRNSQWLIKNIIMNDKLSSLDLVWQIMLFRIFNNPNTFSFIENQLGLEHGMFKYDKWNETDMKQMIKDIRDCNANPFTSSYFIHHPSKFGTKRDDFYCDKVLPQMHMIAPYIIHNAKNPNISVEGLIKIIMEIPAVSWFIAHEFYIDFCYIAKYTDRKIFDFDEDSWTNAGPGASFGLRLLFPSAPTRMYEDLISELTEVAEYELITRQFKFIGWDKDKKCYLLTNNNITMHQIEMWLCEYCKYWKIQNNVGKRREKYVSKPTTQNLFKQQFIG